MGVITMKASTRFTVKNISVSIIIGFIIFGALIKYIGAVLSVFIGLTIFILLYLFLRKFTTYELNYIKPIFSYTGEQGIYNNGESELTFNWRDVVNVEIITTDQGPFVDDLWWVFFLSDDSYIPISGNAEGCNDLIDCIVNQLGEPDWHQIIESSGSCENASFKVWDRLGETMG
ncbi:MAG: hypothetical protein ACI8SR_000928 [Oceanicoccus sp.]|jgi:hypothetical protein